MHELSLTSSPTAAMAAMAPHAIEPIERVFDVYVHRLVVIVATVVRFVDDEVHGRPRARRVLRLALAPAPILNAPPPLWAGGALSKS